MSHNFHNGFHDPDIVSEVLKHSKSWKDDVNYIKASGAHLSDLNLEPTKRKIAKSMLHTSRMKKEINHLFAQIQYVDSHDFHREWLHYITKLRDIKAFIVSRMEPLQLYRFPIILLFLIQRVDGARGLTTAGNPIDDQFLSVVLDRFIRYWIQSNHFPVKTIVQMILHGYVFGYRAKKPFILKTVYHDDTKFTNTIIRSMPPFWQNQLRKHLNRLQPLYNVPWDDWMDAALKITDPGPYDDRTDFYSDSHFFNDSSDSDDSDSDSESSRHSHSGSDSDY